MSKMDEFIEDCLREHNAKRALHNAPPLKHSRALDRSAQDWAEELIGEETTKNSPLSSRGEIGENISMRTSTGVHVDISESEVVCQWYADNKNYNYDSCTGPAGNFTQLVWKTTREVGFGKARASGKCIIVAHYRPPGNIRGRYKENVLPQSDVPVGKGSSTVASDADPKDSKRSEQTTTVTDLDGKTYLLHREVVESTTVDGQVKRSVNEVYTEAKKSGEHLGPPSPMNLLNEKDAHINELVQFTQSVTEAHNAYRDLHGTAPLTMNQELSALAQKWADHLLDQEHISNSGYKYRSMRLGENVFSRWSNSTAQCSSQELLDIWYKESIKYKYTTEPESIQGIGSFTQIVWNSSRLLGVGYAMRPPQPDGTTPAAKSSSKLIIVCFYYPSGNITSEFVANVNIPTKSANEIALSKLSV